VTDVAYRHTHRVTFADTNVVGNVYFSRFVDWQGRARELFLLDHAPSVVEELKTDLVMVTTRVECEFFAEVFAGDEIAIEHHLGQIAAHRIDLEFTYRRLPTSELVARGRQQVACLRRAGGDLQPVEVPDELGGAARRFPGSAPAPSTR
jgi:enediyne biosynthesis thioesterase